MSPDLLKQYEALITAAASADNEAFVALWNALPEGLRRSIDFQIRDEHLSRQDCMEQFASRNGRPIAALHFFESWETGIANGTNVWVSRPYENKKDDKTLLVSRAERAEMLAAAREKMIRRER